MPNGSPFNLSREQLMNLGPVRTVPQQPVYRARGDLDRAEEMHRKALENQIADLRKIASFAEIPQFSAYVQSKVSSSLKAMLMAKNDDERRDTQAAAKVWATISFDVVTATEQVVRLSEQLEEITNRKV